MSEPNSLRWGILGAARIATAKVIPAMLATPRARVAAIASRDLAKARTAAAELRIATAYGSYEELIDDPDIDAIYNPLPNHLHVPWSLRAAAAGKHVLCEKPIALSAVEARTLKAAHERYGVLIGEAFMVRTHPQWIAVQRLIAEGRIGPLRLISGYFSYHRRDPNDIRSRPEFGGGALMDIGCYPVTLARWLFEREPARCIAQVERDPDLRIDRLTSAMLEFPNGQATFSCGTQLVPFQQMTIFGERGRIEVEIPFNAPPDKPNRYFVQGMVMNEGKTHELPVSDQYQRQAEAFGRVIRKEENAAYGIKDAIQNMKIIDAFFRSEKSRKWEEV